MSNYETLPEFVEADDGSAKLHASWTPNNGIRVQIINQFDEQDRTDEHGDDGWDTYWRVFDFTHEQAITLGEALIRWGKDSH